MTLAELHKSRAHEDAMLSEQERAIKQKREDEIAQALLTRANRFRFPASEDLFRDVTKKV
jgi:hypothetical protein